MTRTHTLVLAFPVEDRAMAQGKLRAEAVDTFRATTRQANVFLASPVQTEIRHGDPAIVFAYAGVAVAEEMADYLEAYWPAQWTPETTIQALADGDLHRRDRLRLAQQRPARPPWPVRADIDITPQGAVVPAAPVLTDEGDE